MPTSLDPAGCHGGAVRPGAAVPTAGGDSVSGVALRRGPGASCQPGAHLTTFRRVGRETVLRAEATCTLRRVVFVHTSNNLRAGGAARHVEELNR
jgi:hypothetical protein